MPRRLPNYCCEDTDRHGNVRLYFRRGKAKIRIRAIVGTDEFRRIYASLMAGGDADPSSMKPRCLPHSWKWLCQQYFSSVQYLQLEPSTQKARRRILEGTFIERIRPDSEKCLGDMPIRHFDRQVIRLLQKRKLDLPSAANVRTKAISIVFSFGMNELPKIVLSNPCHHIEPLKTSKAGFYSWTKEEVFQYLAFHKAGTKACLALKLLLFTGVRRSDAVTLGWQMIRNGKLCFTPKKTRRSSEEKLILPILEPLRAELEMIRNKRLTFLLTEYGKPFSSNGFGNKFKSWCREAGLNHCSAHGLRKAGAVIAAEMGASENVLRALYGWRGDQMAVTYTRAANQEKLAELAGNYLVRGIEPLKSVSPDAVGGTEQGKCLGQSDTSDGDWRSHGESNPGFSLERAAS